jgi:hypothetical protein
LGDLYIKMAKMGDFNMKSGLSGFKGGDGE